MFCALHIPDFAAAAIIRAEPELRGCAVAVLEGTPPLLRVAAMNEDARCQGVEFGMMKLEAEALPDLALRRGSSAAEAAAEAALLDCAHGFSPRVEPLAPDTVLLDAAGLERLFGPPPQLAKEIVARAAALGIEPNVAVAHNREAAIHAARGFPGVTIIPCGQEARQLGDLPIDVLFAGPDASGLPNCRTAELPNFQNIHGSNLSEGQGFSRDVPSSKTAAGVRSSNRRSHRKPREYREAPNFDDQKTAAQFGGSAVRQFGNWFIGTLDRWGVHNLRAFAALPTVAVAERLGQEGVRLQKMARGEGSGDLVPAEPPLHFVESMELEHPVELLEPLAFIFARLLEQLCARLSARALATNELRLALTLDSAVRDEETDRPPRRHEDTKDSRIRLRALRVFVVKNYFGAAPIGCCSASPEVNL
jgi:nucleotidyltransferase/DNA polymerase involved in DNA repair